MRFCDAKFRRNITQLSVSFEDVRSELSFKNTSCLSSFELNTCGSSAVFYVMFDNFIIIRKIFLGNIIIKVNLWIGLIAQFRICKSLSDRTNTKESCDRYYEIFLDTSVLTAKLLVLFSFLFQFYAVESVFKVPLALYVDVGRSLLYKHRLNGNIAVKSLDV